MGAGCPFARGPSRLVLQSPTLDPDAVCSRLGSDVPGITSERLTP